MFTYFYISQFDERILANAEIIFWQEVGITNMKKQVDALPAMLREEWRESLHLATIANGKIEAALEAAGVYNYLKSNIPYRHLARSD